MATFLVVGGIIFIIGVLLYVAPAFLPPKRSLSPVAAETTAPSAADFRESTGPVTKVARAITWPQLVDENAGALTVDERRSVIDGLALVGDPWCAQILAAAYGEEGEALRESVIDAIGQCQGAVIPTLERAFKSHRIGERYAAVDAASRRGDVDLLERGLRDTDGTVALAAAYGLVRAGRRDLVDAGLAGRDDVRAAEIRRALPALA
jgi:HEAT repeat protein